MTLGECFWHLATLGWELLFSLIPVKKYPSGSLLLSYVLITFIMCLMREYTSLIACLYNVPEPFLSLTIQAIAVNLFEVQSLYTMLTDHLSHHRHT